jgi:hypothetical protein
MVVSTSRPVSKNLRIEVVVDDGNRAIFRLVYRGKYRVAVNIWPADRTKEQIFQVTARWQQQQQQQVLLAAAAMPMQ